MKDVKGIRSLASFLLPGLGIGGYQTHGGDDRTGAIKRHIQQWQTKMATKITTPPEAFTTESLEQSGTLAVELCGRSVALRVRRHARARNLILRIEEDGSGMVVTVPYGVAVRQAVDLAESRAEWILSQLDSCLPQVPFEDGMVLPFLGHDHHVRHEPNRRGAVWREGQAIHVTGGPEHLPRRLGDWLKAEARREMSSRAHAKAALIEKRIARISIKDMRSRWGSCGEEGGLSFAWRLIMAPDWVLDYVVAHEVAHLKHLDHSARFWKVAAELTTSDVKAAEKWLDNYGNTLYRYG